mmetsp:Transcript_14644/g.31837  ORF Transcript_14644/g.31837 Transcript_14644/m.31837 type:complete len:135 (+) Transcript_14644:118-522(+)|eukprot:CAMPEP_0172310514 /NCGR_PEP_ID=MMETSP1058-20130122/11528_1 /TAXON_ID=83371 /ORGANISM="Detonula confervacea, Strain CCMP 353" /LENGTH=134 /DNA_ID=CAMNT_0013023329 /DNA_START=69 /DNA_END=473 /DNA_ORIENTATION=-
MAETKSYGAVEVPEGNDTFDEKNAYYLNESESRFSWTRFSRAAVPIIIALVIMGGFGYGMSHGFNNLYGPPKGTGDDSIKQDESWIPLDNSNDDSGGTLSGSSAKCAKHEKCAALALLGNCCPTNKGGMLECCN